MHRLDEHILHPTSSQGDWQAVWPCTWKIKMKSVQGRKMYNFCHSGSKAAVPDSWMSHLYNNSLILKDRTIRWSRWIFIIKIIRNILTSVNVKRCLAHWRRAVIHWFPDLFWVAQACTHVWSHDSHIVPPNKNTFNQMCVNIRCSKKKKKPPWWRG